MIGTALRIGLLEPTARLRIEPVERIRFVGLAEISERARVAAELKTTFASHYAREISLSEALQPDVVAVYNQRATGEKFLLAPNRGLS